MSRQGMCVLPFACLNVVCMYACISGLMCVLGGQSFETFGPWLPAVQALAIVFAICGETQEAAT